MPQITPLLQFELFLLSAFAGGFGSIIGLGGGVILIPAMTLFLGIPIRYAIGASVISVIASSSASAAVYVRDRLTNVRLGIFLEVATTLGAVTGAGLSSLVPTKHLYLLFSILLFYSAFIMMRKRESNQLTRSKDWLAARLGLNSSYPDRALGRQVQYAVQRVPTGFALMFAAGLVGGLLGIGAGVLKVPAMDAAMQLPIKVSSATSSFMIGVTAAASALAYYSRGMILPFLAAPVALGVLGGATLGTQLLHRLQPNTIRYIFVAVLCLVAVQMGLKYFGVSFG